MHKHKACRVIEERGRDDGKSKIIIPGYSKEGKTKRLHAEIVEVSVEEVITNW
jgi:hypothetical protein